MSRWMASRKTKGNETVSLVRDALTGRVLAAEQVTSSDTEGMKTLLAPVVALERERKVNVLGTITDAQESERFAVEAVFPGVPHQVCPFHALRDASASACEAEKQVKTAMRTRLQPQVRAVRTQITKRLPKALPQEAQQRAVLEDSATGVLPALNTDGLQPFASATVKESVMVEEIETSLSQLGKKGGR